MSFSDYELDMLITTGLITKNKDGTFRLSDEAHDYLTKKLQEDPTLFAKWFPERLY